MVEVEEEKTRNKDNETREQHQTIGPNHVGENMGDRQKSEQKRMRGEMREELNKKKNQKLKIS